EVVRDAVAEPVHAAPRDGPGRGVARVGRDEVDATGLALGRIRDAMAGSIRIRERARDVPRAEARDTGRGERRREARVPRVLLQVGDVVTGCGESQGGEEREDHRGAAGSLARTAFTCDGAQKSVAASAGLEFAGTLAMNSRTENGDSRISKHDP